MKKLLKALLIIAALGLSGVVCYKAYFFQNYKTASKLVEKELKIESPKDYAIMAEISPTQGIKVIIDNDDTSWKSWVPIMQLLVILIGTYGGIKVINKYTK